MSKLGSWVSFNSFKGGEKSDLPAHIIPDDSLLGAVNVVTDKIGRLSKRGPIQQYLTNTTTAIIRRIGISKAIIGGLSPSVGYGVSNGSWYTFDLPDPPTTKRAGALGSATPFTNAAKTIPLTQPEWGPSFNSFGLTAFPLNSSGADPFVFFANARNNTYAAQTTTGTITVNANNQEVTASGATSFNSNHIGHFIYLNNNAAGTPTREYIGIITGVVTTTAVTVYPTPSQAFTAAANGLISVSPFASLTGRLTEAGNSLVPASASFGCVHQNRIVALVDKTATYNGTLLSTPVETQHNVLSWSSITASPASSANSGSDGFLPLLYAGWPKSQSLTLDTAEVVALVSIDANNLLVLCSDKILLIAGTLGAILPSVPIDEKSFNIRTLSAEIGCIDPESVQRTPLGVMFAGRDGVYLTDGSKFVNTMADKIQQKWDVYLRSSGNPNNSVVGSALIKDTHYVIFSEYGPHFICDLYNNFSWTELTINPDAGATMATADLTFNIDGSGGALTPPAGTSNRLGDLLSVSSTADRIVSNKNYYSAISGAYEDMVVYANSGTQSSPSYSVEYSAGGIGNFADIQDVAIDDAGSRIALKQSTTGLLTFTRTGSTWSSEVSIGVFGDKVAISKTSSDRIVIGDQTNSSNQGRVFIYKRTGTSWAIETTINGPLAASRFGASVDISSDGLRIIVGAPTANTSNGLAYVYVRSGTSWSLEATLTPASLVASAQYGTSVAFSPNQSIAVVGAPASGFGKAYVWSRTGSSWTESTSFTGVASGSLFGTAVSCDNTSVCVGAPTSNSVSLYEYSDNVWQYANGVTGSSGSNFGKTVKISSDGNVLVTGAPNY